MFLLGTRTGKNLLKIISEQGLDGLINLLEEYDLEGFEEIDDMEEVPEQDAGASATEGEEPKKSPKHRFFRRIRK